MIAKMTIANRTKSPIWSNGAMAFIIDFKTTCKPRSIVKSITHTPFGMEREKIEIVSRSSLIYIEKNVLMNEIELRKTQKWIHTTNSLLKSKKNYKLEKC